MSSLKLINRSYVRVIPKNAFWQGIDPNGKDREFHQFHEPTLYLLEEELWDERFFLEKNYLKIAHFELQQHLEIAEIPQHLPKTVEDFNELFEMGFGSTVVDLLLKPGLGYL